MLKIPISGGPHTGKTSLLGALREEYPSAYFVAEPATNVIARELKRNKIYPEYTPVVPWTDYSLFGPEVTDESVALEAAIPTNALLVFQDRCLIDTIGYYRLNGLERFVPDIKRRIKTANYAFALFCEPVGDYTATHIRRETPEQARLTHEYLARAYDESGIEVIHLPAVSIEERLRDVRNKIGSIGLEGELIQ